MKKDLILFIILIFIVAPYCNKKSSKPKPVKTPKNIVLTSDDPSFNSTTGEFVKDKYTMGLWHFNEGKDKFLFDSSGNDNHGVIIGGKWDKGVFKNSFNLSDINDYVSIEHSSSLNSLYAITVEGWVYINEYQTGSFPTFLSKLVHRKEGFYPSYAFWMVKYAHHKFFKTFTLHWWINVNDSGEEYDYVLNSRVPWKSLANEWHYFAGTYDGKESRIYIDGKLIATKEITGLLRVGKESLYFGTSGHGTKNFDGKIDEIRISNVARSEKAIKEYWNATKKYVIE